MSFHTLSERVNILVQLIIVANKTSPGKAHYCHYFSNCTEEKKKYFGAEGTAKKTFPPRTGQHKKLLPPTNLLSVDTPRWQHPRAGEQKSDLFPDLL